MKITKLDKYLKLFTTCILVRGVGRACIYDLQRKNVYPIPLSLADIFDENGLCNQKQIWNTLDHESQSIFIEYITFLVENELVFECDKSEVVLFPNLSEEFLFPSQISNAIFDSNSDLKYFTREFLSQLEKIGCNHIQFRFFNFIDLNELYRILEILRPSQIKSFEIIMPEKNDSSFYSTINEIIKQNQKISSIIITGTDKSEIYKQGSDGLGFILKVTEHINGSHHCGLIDKSNFSVNIATYTESLNFNSCLNRKISIDLNGDIKNCPSMRESFGNIYSTTLEAAVNHPGFRKYWGIKKDMISKCKDCEFRHICTDCRAYLDDPSNNFSAPLKCGYDPYTNTWEDWTANPLKKEAINFYAINRN